VHCGSFFFKKNLEYRRNAIDLVEDRQGGTIDTVPLFTLTKLMHRVNRRPIFITNKRTHTFSMKLRTWFWITATALLSSGCKPMDLLVSADSLTKASYQETYLGMLHLQKVVGERVEEYTDPVPVSMAGDGKTVEISGLTGIGSIRLACGSYYTTDPENSSGSKLVEVGRVSGLVAEVVSETEMKVVAFRFRDEEATQHQLTVRGTIKLKESKKVLETEAPQHITIYAEILDEKGQATTREMVRLRFSGELTTPI
jgi:hypothetical protein